MPAFIIPGRAVGTRPPFYGVNDGSVQAQGLVGWWPRGLQRRPAIGPSTTVSGGNAAEIESPFGPATEFSSDRLVAAVSLSPPFTLCTWFYSTSLTTNQILILPFSDINNAYQLSARGSDAGDYLKFYAGAEASWSSSASASAYAIDRWQHAGGVCRSITDRLVFLDGRPGTRDTASRNPGTQPNTYFGAWQAGGELLAGFLADVRLYNRALSDAEMYALYDPATRWSLYWVPSRRVYIDAPAATGAATASTSDSVTLTEAATQTVGILVSASEFTGSDTVTSSNW